ncbi:hypothetical protein H5410_026211 [Solanum commersonii]|uniref:Uncharacterized protein n=1 Tax=Solanum commersonii TaxID=4109 RepID=A0A9J5YYB0_SOLCO|nr:hypothetical protein H5410_026211 [Solanum commersonii]
MTKKSKKPYNRLALRLLSTMFLPLEKNQQGRRWSADEERAFFIALDKLGKGNWTRIAKEFVPSRTIGEWGIVVRGVG